MSLIVFLLSCEGRQEVWLPKYKLMCVQPYCAFDTNSFTCSVCALGGGEGDSVIISNFAFYSQP